MKRRNFIKLGAGTIALGNVTVTVKEDAKNILKEIV